jgi:glycosyltransferase involved in cell wall biosynthesis
MHVLQLLPRLDVGGVERGVLDLSAGLIARGQQVTVVSAGGRLVEPLTRLGARHVTLPVHDKSLWSIARCIPRVTRLVRELGVQVIHARSRVPGWIGYGASRRTGVPFITTCHGFYSPHLASRVMAWGRTIIVPSRALGRYIIDRFGAPPERLRVIPRGVDLAAFPLRAEAPVGEGIRPWRIGLVGRVTAIKGHEVALRAVHALRQQGIGAVLRVIGDAPADKPQLRRHLELVAAELSITNAVEWLGVHQPKQLPRESVPDSGLPDADTVHIKSNVQLECRYQ